MLWSCSPSRSLVQRPSMHASPGSHCELRVQRPPEPTGLLVQAAPAPKSTVSPNAHRKACTLSSLSDHDENRALLDGLPFAAAHLEHLTDDRALDRHLHLHRLEDDHGVAFG